MRVLRGLREGEAIALGPRESVAGREASCAIQFADRGLSRRHCKFLRAADGLVSVIDLRSTNGTFVNGAGIDVASLRDGDHIQLGSSVLLQLGYEEARATASAALPLTPRQREIARLVADGLTSAAIGERLGVKTRTITTHLENIYTRLGISSRAALTRMVVEARADEN